jgi:drug/metabolite transporter (DMT)-like permease
MYVAGRVVAQLLPHFTTATFRFAIASAILVPLAYARDGGLPRLDRRRFGAMLALALTGVFFFNACFFAALERIPAGRGALIMALIPVMTAIGASLVFGEGMTKLRVLGIVIALAGTAIVITRGDLTTLGNTAVGIGDLLMFGSALGWVSYTLIGRRVLRGMSPLGATTWSALLGTVLLAVAAVFEQPWSAIAALPAHGWWSIAYLGSLGTVFAFLWYYQGVQRLGASRAAIFINLVPVFTIAFAALLLGEPILGSMVVGGLVVIGGVVLTNRPARPATPR